jgi:hypothetical protein
MWTEAIIACVKILTISHKNWSPAYSSYVTTCHIASRKDIYLSIDGSTALCLALASFSVA